MVPKYCIAGSLQRSKHRNWIDIIFIQRSESFFSHFPVISLRVFVSVSVGFRYSNQIIRCGVDVWEAEVVVGVAEAGVEVELEEEGDPPMRAITWLTIISDATAITRPIIE